MIKAEMGIEEEVHIEHPDKNKEMDLYMIRQDRQGRVTENVVVELKRPKNKIGRKRIVASKKIYASNKEILRDLMLVMLNGHFIWWE